MRSLNVAILATVLVIAFGGILFATNPVDLTETYRLTPVQFLKVTYDDGPKSVFVNVPAGKDLSVSIFDWQNAESTIRSSDLKMLKRFSSSFDVTLNTQEKWSKGTITLREEAAFDLRIDRFGLGLLIPFQPAEKVKIGPRIKMGDITAYFTISEGADPIYGLSYATNGLRFDIARDNAIWYFRTSKDFKSSIGTIIPELRLKFTEEERFTGLAIGIAF